MNKVEQINSLQNLEDIIGFATACFTDKNSWVIPRIKELLQMCVDDNIVASIDSLKSMLIFLINLEDTNKIGMAVGENGLFCLIWRKETFYSMTLQFNSNKLINYIMLLPSESPNNNRTIMLSGVTDVESFYLIFIKHSYNINEKITNLIF